MSRLFILAWLGIFIISAPAQAAKWEQLNIQGRYMLGENKEIIMAYPGVMIDFNAHSKHIQIEAKSSTGKGMLDIFLDGNFSHSIDLSTEAKSYNLVFSENASNTRVRILNRSETWQSVNHIKHINLNEGQWLAPPPPPVRKIMLIGDSITCGSVIARSAYCNTDISSHDIKRSYGYSLAQQLDAQLHLVCFGGRGITRSWNNNPADIQLPIIFDKTIPENTESPNWQHSRYQPDAIIINLGTNDFNLGVPDQELFESTYQSMLTRIREVNPKAQIMLTEGPMLGGDKKVRAAQFIQNVRNKVADDAIHYLPATRYAGDSCDAHPTAEQHAKMSQEIVPHIRKHLGW